MADDLDPGPPGDLVLLQRAVDEERAATGMRRRVRALTVVGSVLSLGWVNALSLPLVLFGIGAMLWSTRRLDRIANWQRAVPAYGLGLVVLALAGWSGAPLLLSAWFLVYLVGVAGFVMLAAGYVRVLRGRAAVQRAFGLRHEVALRQRRRSEQARYDAGRRLAPAADTQPEPVEPAWPSADAPLPLPDLPPWEQQGLADPADALPGGQAAPKTPDRDRRPTVDVDSLRPGFHGWVKSDTKQVTPSESVDVRPADASDPPAAG